MAVLKYEKAQDLNELIADIIKTLKLKHLKPERVPCVRSRGSTSKYIIARIHALQRIVAEALNIKTIYVIEAISENFDKLDDEEKIKTIIHELLHVPKNMGGGLLGHRRYVNSRRVKKAYKEYIKAKTHPQVEIELTAGRRPRSRSSGT